LTCLTCEDNPVQDSIERRARGDGSDWSEMARQISGELISGKCIVSGITHE
jgi:hypothetical protein